MPPALDRIGIVGASGYIGGALIRALMSDGHLLRLFGRRRGTIAGLELEPLAHGSEQFVGLDCIVHLSGITTSRASEALLRQANVDLAVQTGLKAAAAGVKRFIFVSSLHVHGKTAEYPVAPDSPFKFDNAYGKSKFEAEVALADVFAGKPTELVILRPPMIYGRGSKGSFGLLVKFVGTGLPLPLAAARGRRTFCSIANLVSAIHHCIKSSDPAPVLIPADPEDFDTQSLIRALAGIMGRPSLLWYAPKPLLELPLALIGRREMIVSLYEPLQVDRSHWEGQEWRPVESGMQGLSAAVRHR